MCTARYNCSIVQILEGTVMQLYMSAEQLKMISHVGYIHGFNANEISKEWLTSAQLRKYFRKLGVSLPNHI